MRRYPHALLLTMLMMVLAGEAIGAEALAAWKRGKTPPLALKDLQGRVHTLDQYAGQVVVINFWATWCEPCVEEMPSLERLKQSMKDAPFIVLAVNLGESETRMNSFAQKIKVAFPMLMDPDGVAKRDWKVRGAPATFVIDDRGRIRYSHVGALDFTAMETEVKITGLIKKIKNKADRKIP